MPIQKVSPGHLPSVPSGRVAVGFILGSITTVCLWGVELW